MAYINKITKKRIYDNIDGVDSPVHISWSTQEIGTGDDAGRTGRLVTTSAVPGTFANDTYTRTDVTGFPASIQALIGALWTDHVHTQYEAYLRSATIVQGVVI